MRVAVVMNQKSPWAREIAMQLTDLGTEVHVIDFETPGSQPEYLAGQGEKQAKAIATFQSRVTAVHPIKSSFSSGLRYLTCALKVRRICELIRPQFLITLYGGGSGLMAWASGFRPYVVYVVGSDVLLARNGRQFVSRLVLGNADLVFANGKYLAQQTLRLAPGANVVPLYMGVDIKRFKAVIRKPSPMTRLVSTRGFLSVYNNEAIVRALALLPDSIGPIGMTFVSSGPLLPHVRELAETTLSPRIRRDTVFLDGANGEQLLEIVQQSAIYISMSRSDGTSISLLEAFACGAFPVVSDIPANREWIDPSAENGLLVPLDDDQALADALARAIGDVRLREKAAVHNRMLVEERADNRRTMPRLLEYLRPIVRGSKPGHPNRSSAAHS